VGGGKRPGPVDGELRQRQKGSTGTKRVSTDIPQGSPVFPVLSKVYLSGLFGSVEEKVPGIKALSFVDDVAWLAEGDEANEISEILEKAAAAAQEWAEANAAAFDAQKTEAILLSRRRKRKTLAPSSPSRGIQVEGRTVNFNLQQTGHPVARSLP